MDESPKIEPALTPEEWASVEGERREQTTTRQLEVDAIVARQDPASTIAVYNAALPDSDPRKITRERMRAVKKAVDIWFGATVTVYNTLADREPHFRVIEFLAGLESYLPPTI